MVARAEPLTRGSVTSVAISRLTSCVPIDAPAGTATHSTTVVLSPDASVTLEIGVPPALVIWPAKPTVLVLVRLNVPVASVLF